MQKCKCFVNMHIDTIASKETGSSFVRKDVLRWQIKVQRLVAMILTSWSSHKD